MRAPQSLHRAVLGVMGVLAWCTGCAGSPPANPAGLSPVAAPGPSAVVHLSGLLTLKGPELGAWWALTEDHGQVWLLEPADAALSASFRQWQNSRVAVDGSPAGKLLSTPRLRVLKAAQVP